MARGKKIEVSDSWLMERFRYWLLKTGQDSPLKDVHLSVASKNLWEVDNTPLGDVFYVQRMGAEQLLWFFNNSFGVHNLCTESTTDKFAGAIRDYRFDPNPRDNQKQVRIFRHIFGEPEFSYGGLTFKGTKRYGVTIETPIRHIPIGPGGDFSERIFVYAERGIARPARKVLAEILEEPKSSI